MFKQLADRLLRMTDRLVASGSRTEEAPGHWHLAEVHAFERLGRHILFDVSSMQCYETTPVVHAVVEAFRDGVGDPVRALGKRHPRREVGQAIEHLRQSGVLRAGPKPVVRSRPRLTRRLGIRHLELMVTHACNMRCRYCYGSDDRAGWQDATHLYGASQAGMSWDTARQGVDFLFEASGSQKDLSVIFFGGEPLLEFDLIRQVVAYVRDKERATGKRVSFSVSTNGMGLSQEVVDFLVRENIACQVSIDGPQAMHDHNRVLASGKGSYDRVMQGVQRLIDRRPGRVPARVTVTGGQVDLPAVADHLLNLGFGSIHVEPVIGASGMALADADLGRFESQTEQLAEYLVNRVKEGRIFNFSNLVRHVRQIRVIDQRLAHYCGAARTYLALGQDGAFYPCHRFVGMADYRMGDLATGFDDTLQKRILHLTVDNRPGCSECWARYLCGGGCWKHGVDVNGDLAEPDTESSCRLIRHQIECAMAINGTLRVDDRTLLSQAYERAEEPYRLPEQGSGS